MGMFWAVGRLLLKGVWIGGVGRSRTGRTPGLGRLQVGARASAGKVLFL